MMKQILSEVGRGKRGARDLSYDEARKAADLIYKREATDSQIGAFLMAERIKMESIDELKAFIDSGTDYFKPIQFKDTINCAGPYDGRKKSFYATFPSAFVLACNDLPVTLRTAPSMPPKWGMTLLDILHNLNISIETIEIDRLLQAAKEVGVLTIPAERLFSPLHELRSIRVELGMRTLFNTVEKLINFSSSPYIVMGVFHGTVFEKMAALIQQLGYRSGMIIQGVEGSEDLHIDRPTRTLLIHHDNSELFIVDPEIYDMRADIPEIEWTPELQVKICEEVLQNKAHPAFENMVVLNSAVRLYAANAVDSVEEGIYCAKRVLNDGLAYEKYKNWISLLQLIDS